jgi:hypothetical protein
VIRAGRTEKCAVADYDEQYLSNLPDGFNVSQTGSIKYVWGWNNVDCNLTRPYMCKYLPGGSARLACRRLCPCTGGSACRTWRHTHRP